tara:strand:+ start:82 stop:591 length:510 start_codon:yes stop_codon:yes gene_type:complete
MANRRKKNNFKTRNTVNATVVKNKIKLHEDLLAEDIKRLKQLEDFQRECRHMESPHWANEVAKLVRQGQKLQAVKTIKDYEGCSLKKAKDSVDYYIEHGKWDNWKWKTKNHLDRAFRSVMGVSVEEVKRRWETEKDELFEKYKELDMTLISLDSCFNICEEYINQILKR